MTMWFAWILSLALLLNPVADTAVDNPGQTHFSTVDILLDSGDNTLAAYQLEFKATAGDVKIVGIEGGEHPTFNEPPFYDPKAMQQQRVILASFNTADADDLPTGRTRIATIHLHVTGETEPQFAIDLTVAADEQGNPIHAETELQGHNP